jgi:hypothetical protein
LGDARKLLTDAVLVAATTMVAAGAALAGAGQALAVPDVVDRPYRDAKGLIERTGARAVVATRTGNGADDMNCLVTNAWEAAVRRPDSRGRLMENREVMVALNCNGALAGPGSAGNSALSPAGRDAKSAMD